MEATRNSDVVASGASARSATSASARAAAGAGASAARGLGTRAEADRATLVMPVLSALSVGHLLNDTIQTLPLAMYPVLKDAFALNYTQIGLITFVFQLAGSLLQPVVGAYTDKRPRPYSLAIGMGITLVGLVLLSQAWSYGAIIASVALIGTGSAIFHPEASRVARLASGGRHGFAQSFFQVGGNLGSSFGPLAAMLVVARGQGAVLWFGLVALLGIAVLGWAGNWYAGFLGNKAERQPKRASGGSEPRPTGARILTQPATVAKTAWIVGVLLVLIFSKYFYMVSISNYYTFYLIDKLGLSVYGAQLCLFAFLFAVAAGTIIGGLVGDRIGRKQVIWASILGSAPFSLALPQVDALWAMVALTVVIGVVLASAFSAILVYAQELIPGRVGLVSGLFFGFAFGAGGLGSALLGRLADATSIETVFQICAWLPLLGLLAGLLPKDPGAARH